MPKGPNTPNWLQMTSGNKGCCTASPVSGTKVEHTAKIKANGRLAQEWEITQCQQVVVVCFRLTKRMEDTDRCLQIQTIMIHTKQRLPPIFTPLWLWAMMISLKYCKSNNDFSIVPSWSLFVCVCQFLMLRVSPPPGTLQAKRGSEPSPQPTTEVPW